MVSNYLVKIKGPKKI